MSPMPDTTVFDAALATQPNIAASTRRATPKPKKNAFYKFFTPSQTRKTQVNNNVGIFFVICLLVLDAIMLSADLKLHSQPEGLFATPVHGNNLTCPSQGLSAVLTCLAFGLDAMAAGVLYAFKRGSILVSWLICAIIALAVSNVKRWDVEQAMLVLIVLQLVVTSGCWLSGVYYNREKANVKIE